MATVHGHRSVGPLWHSRTRLAPTCLQVFASLEAGPGHERAVTVCDDERTLEAGSERCTFARVFGGIAGREESVYAQVGGCLCPCAAVLQKPS